MQRNAEEDLALIRRLMEDGRREVVDRGKHFLIWGLVPVVGLLATYARLAGWRGPDPGWVWVVVLAVGWALSFGVGWRDGRSARVATLARRILSATWIATGVTLTLIGVAGIFGDVVDARGLPGLLSAVLAVPILISSLLTGVRWLAWVAAGWWAGAVVMLFVPGAYPLLLMAAMSLLLMAVPGGVLYARSRRTDGGSTRALVEGT